MTQSPFAWLGQQYSIAHLGEYKGSDALSKKIVEKKGATDSGSLKEYGAVAGGMGATGACVALGITAPVAVGCGILGGLIGGALASLVPLAKGSTMQDVVIDAWDDKIKPYLDTAPKGILAIKAYLVMRDKFIADAGGSASQVDAFLTSQGLPGAPVRARWAPITARSLAGEAFAVWQIPKGGVSDECGAAKNVYGVTCQEYLLLREHCAPPIAAAKDPIDWGLVGYDEFLKVKGYQTTCDITSADFTKPYGQNMIPRTCPTEQPTKVAATLIEKLAQVKYTALPPPVVAGGGGGGGGTLVKGAAVAAAVGVGLAIWKPALLSAAKKAIFK